MKLTPILLLLFLPSMESVRHSGSVEIDDQELERLLRQEMKERQEMEERHARERENLEEKYKKVHEGETGAGAMVVPPEIEKPKEGVVIRGFSMRKSKVTNTTTTEETPTDFAPLCSKFAVTIKGHCRGLQKDTYAIKCWNYFKDCMKFIPKGDSMYAVGLIYRMMPKPASTNAEEKQCVHLLSTVRRHCHGERTEDGLKAHCNAFFRQCSSLIDKGDSLYRIAQKALASSKDKHPVEDSLTPEAKAVLRSECEKYLPDTRQNCRRRDTDKRFVNKCIAYFQDCGRFISPADYLYPMASAMGSGGSGLNIPAWAFRGIPKYYTNSDPRERESVLARVPAAGYGAGYSGGFGVGDYWSQYMDTGANWYNGKYGFTGGWSVPGLRELGIEGEAHATASVPPSGNPIGVDIGGGVGPYYQQNQHIGVDWRDGNINNVFTAGSPIGHAGFQTGTAVAFPGFDTWARALG